LLVGWSFWRFRGNATQPISSTATQIARSDIPTIENLPGLNAFKTSSSHCA
jgi:hypothetical protein